MIISQSRLDEIQDCMKVPKDSLFGEIFRMKEAKLHKRTEVSNRGGK